MERHRAARGGRRPPPPARPAGRAPPSRRLGRPRPPRTTLAPATPNFARSRLPGIARPGPAGHGSEREHGGQPAGIHARVPRLWDAPWLTGGEEEEQGHRSGGFQDGGGRESPERRSLGRRRDEVE
jgi:hypothetical protein